MYSYITEELPATVFEAFKDQIDAERVSITGHSMGGHGALTLVRPPFHPLSPQYCVWRDVPC
jgi:S-formylglutathione hydrolase FrmB